MEVMTVDTGVTAVIIIIITTIINSETARDEESPCRWTS